MLRRRPLIAAWRIRAAIIGMTDREEVPAGSGIVRGGWPDQTSRRRGDLEIETEDREADGGEVASGDKGATGTLDLSRVPSPGSRGHS
jgi:hypothetical protein